MTVADGVNVFLELARRRDTFPNDTSANTLVNRIPLYATDITLSISKMTPNLPIPFSGAVRGESTNVAFDMGLASKTISMSGLLLEQSISKSKTSEEDRQNIKFTSFELAQLIHSYVDSSSFQKDQSLDKIIILYPSRVGNDFNMRTKDKAEQTVTEDEMKNLNIEDVPLTSWHWKNRFYDNDFTALSGNTESSPGNYFDAVTNTDEMIGTQGFIRSFSTTISGAEFPHLNFQLEFEEAVVINDNMFD